MLLFEIIIKLKLINSNSRLALFTDTSNISSGFILAEIDPKTLDFHPILADSRMFTQSERNASIVHKEILSVLFWLGRFESYIWATHHQFLLFSDCLSISYIKQMKYFSPKIAETALFLSSFPNVIPIFIKGKFNLVKDLLPRRIYQGTIKGENPGTNVSSFIHDIRNYMEDEIVSMSSEAFHKFLLDDPSEKMVDLLCQHRTFKIK